jgi:hypothetical protein
MPDRPNILQVWYWKLRAMQMRRCPSAADLIALCGTPAERVEMGPTSVWHYPLRIMGGCLHSVYVTMTGHRPVAAQYQVEALQPDGTAAPAKPPDPETELEEMAELVSAPVEPIQFEAVPGLSVVDQGEPERPPATTP